MGELLERYSKEPQQRYAANTGSVRGPPVPAKDEPSRPPTRGAISAHPVKRRRYVALRLNGLVCYANNLDSHEISGGDKENQVQTPQKKMRANTAGADVARNPAHVLSPTTSNSRFAPRTAATPARSGIARPTPTPGRAVAATNMLNKMVEGGRSTTRPPTAPSSAARKTLNGTSTTATTASASASASAAAAARRKRGATVSAAAGNPPSSASRPATRTARRASGASESSEDSASTVIRKRPMTAPPGAQPKPPPSQQQQQQAASGRRTVMGAIKKGVTGGGGAAKKVPAGKGTTATTGVGGGGTASAGGTARVLRKRA